jgi:sulfate adenylyltransferase
MSAKAKQPVLLPPYAGELINLVCADEETRALAVYANSLPVLQLSERSLCDLELLAVGAFSPLDRFMGQADYQRVLAEMRLTTGQIFPIPITLPARSDFDVREGQDIALCNSQNEPLAVLSVEEIYEWDLDEEANRVFGTRDSRHPLVAEMNNWGKRNLSGPMRVLRLPRHYDFVDLRLTPSQTRAYLENLGHRNVVAFQTRNPLHRAHEEMTKRAIAEKNGVLLLHPAVGLTKPGDVDHYTRVRSYTVLAERYYEPGSVLLALLPLAMRMAGPREALWHALIRRNYGANFLIVGRDHASPGVDSSGKPFYDPYAAQQLVEQFSEETGVGAISFQELVYVPERNQYVEVSDVPAGVSSVSLSGTELRQTFAKGAKLPSWFSRPEVSDILSETYPPLDRQGVCIWFTGLSCAGKSTIAEILTVMLSEHGRRVTILDGDVVRTHLSHGLGFSKEDRDTNVRRIGFVAAEIVRHGGMAICAAVSPYRATRNEVRKMVGPEQFVEVFVDTPLDVCEQRDVKGMYARARRGEITSFTGIDDPYEPPAHAEIRLETVSTSAEINARSTLGYLLQKGFIKKAERASPPNGR